MGIQMAGDIKYIVLNIEISANQKVCKRLGFLITLKRRC